MLRVCLIKLATLLRRELPSLSKGHPTECPHVSVPSTQPINLLPQVFYHRDNFTGHGKETYVVRCSQAVPNDSAHATSMGRSKSSAGRPRT